MSFHRSTLAFAFLSILLCACAKDEETAPPAPESTSAEPAPNPTTPEVAEPSLESRVWTPEEVETLAFERALEAYAPGTVVRLGPGEFRAFALPKGLSLAGDPGGGTTLVIPSFEEGWVQPVVVWSGPTPLSVRDLRIRYDGPEPKDPWDCSMRMIGGGTVENVVFDVAPISGLELSRGRFEARYLEFVSFGAIGLNGAHVHPDSVVEATSFAVGGDQATIHLQSDSGGTFRDLTLPDGASLTVSGDRSAPVFQGIDPFILNDTQYLYGAQPYYDETPPEAIEALREAIANPPVDFDRARAEDFVQHAFRQHAHRAELARDYLGEIEDATDAEVAQEVLSKYIAALNQTYSYESHDPWIDSIAYREMDWFFDTYGAGPTLDLIKLLPERSDGDGAYYYFLLPPEKSDALRAEMQRQAKARQAAKRTSHFATFEQACSEDASPEAIADAFLSGAEAAHEADLNSSNKVISDAFSAAADTLEADALATILARFPTAAEPYGLPDQRTLLRALPSAARRDVVGALRSLDTGE